MKNALIMHYYIFVDTIQKIKDSYYFSYSNNNYVIFVFNRDLNEAEAILNLNNEMLSQGISLYKIIPTRTGQIVFNYENTNYILMMMPNIKNRIITYEDVIRFTYISRDNKIISSLDKSAWSTYWSNKIDFFEYQFGHVENKYPIIRDSIHFYIGLWENAISYFNDNIMANSDHKVVCHKRVDYNMDLLDFYNPLNLVIDYKERDISEYLKSFVLNENFTISKIKKMLDYVRIDRNKSMILISRTLFPSNYFDLYEDIIVDNKDEKIILNVVNKRQNYLILLKIMFEKYKVFNIPFIDWILKEDYY